MRRRLSSWLKFDIIIVMVEKESIKDKKKIDTNVAFFDEKEFSDTLGKGRFVRGSDAKRRSVEWMSDLAVGSMGLALLFQVIMRIVPLGQGAAMLFGGITNLGFGVGLVTTIISTMFVVPLYIKDNKRTSGALGTTLVALVELLLYYLVTFGI